MRRAYIVTSCFISFHDVFCTGAYPALTPSFGSAHANQTNPGQRAQRAS